MAALNLTQRWLPVALLLAFGLWAGRRYGRRNRWFAVGLILMVTGLAYFYGAKKGLFGAWPPQALIADASKVWPFPAPPSGEHVKDFLDVAAAIATIAGLIISLIPFFKPESKVPVLDRARRDMLNLVRVRWITGLLNQTLNEEVQLTPRFIAVPDALQQSDDALPRLNRGNAKEFPAGTSIANIFEGCAERLLILGAPGAGKTTLLLKLTRELLDLAEKDGAARIPVLFPLSSWGANQLPLAEWLVEELVGPRYRVPQKLAENWIADNEILPLLDGLDTVQAECRAACVEAINQFGRQKGLFSLAVSCRESDYEATAAKMELQGAVLVQPLRRKDVSAYWERLGEPAESVRQLLVGDPELWSLLDTPLMVDVVTRAYENQSAGNLKAHGSIKERRRHIFKTYVARMFECLYIASAAAPVNVTRVRRLCAGFPGWLISSFVTI